MGVPAGAGVPGELAEPGQRILAYLVDVAIVVIAAIILGFIGAVLATALGKIGHLISLLLFLVSAVIGLVNMLYLPGADNPLTGRGQSLGKKALNIKVVKMDGSDIGIGDALLRNLVGYMVSSILSLGFIWILIDANKQGWHDKIAKTYVIKA